MTGWLFVLVAILLTGALLCARLGWWKETLILALITVPVAAYTLQHIADGAA